MTSPIVHHPADFHLGFLHLTGFGFAMMLAFGVAHWVSQMVLQQRGDDPDVMNDVTFVEASRKLAERMIASGHNAASRIDFAYRTVLGRTPISEERSVIAQTLAKFEAAYKKDDNAAAELLIE